MVKPLVFHTYEEGGYDEESMEEARETMERV